jgi:short-chain fatty acids transporter
VADSLTRIATAIGRIVPDAMSAAIIFLVVLVLAALLLGDSLTTTADAFYRGLWMLLPFTMQVVLLLVLSAVLSTSPLFRRAIVRLAAVPSTRAQVLIVAVLATAIAGYFYWGLAIVLGPLAAVHVCRAAERKGIAVDFPFVLAVTFVAGSVWQFGLSSSAALLVATPGHFLESTTGVMPLSRTIWSAPAIALVVAFPLALIAVAHLLMPKTPRPISEFPAAEALTREPEPVEPVADGATPIGGFAGKLEHGRWMSGVLVLLLSIWLAYHFGVKGATLDLNAMNAVLLALALLLHRSVASFNRALQSAVPSCWPVLVLYPLYAAVAGVMQYTSVGTALANYMAQQVTAVTYPLITALSGTIVAMFVPSSAGQWTIQGFVAAESAKAVGVSNELALLALGVGDQMGNLLSPFWFLITAGVARVDFRTIFGYGLLLSALWFVLGVAAFTFIR